MKYIVIVGDGMADRPIDDLGGKTPLQHASTPNMDRLAKSGALGTVRTVPQGMHPGSDVANLSILGYDPALYYSGRAPLEAASIGVELRPEDVAYRCNLVTLKFNQNRTCGIMEDYSSGHISTSEASELIKAVDEKLGNASMKFYPGVSYRHLLVWYKGEVDVECVPPHDITGKVIADYLPVGAGEAVIRKLMIDSVDVLENHPINKNRILMGKKPGNSIWLWGQGRRPAMPTFMEKYSLSGALVSAVDLTRGLGIYAGFEILQVPGITGYIDTNYKGKADAAIDALDRVDFVYVHVEAPDEAGHMGNLSDKIRAIEDFDDQVVGRIVEKARKFGDYRILVLPDHPTPIAIKTHSSDPVPFVLYDSAKTVCDQEACFSEEISSRKGAMVFEKGHTLMDYFIKGE